MLQDQASQNGYHDQENHDQYSDIAETDGVRGVRQFGLKQVLHKGLLFLFGQFLLDFFSDLIRGVAQSEGFPDELFAHLTQSLAAQLPGDFRAGRLPDVRAAPVLGGDQPGLVQQPVGARHGVEVHAQVGSQLAHGGELVAGFHLALGDLLADLLDDLDIDRLAGAEVKIELHGVVPSSYSGLYLCMIV